MNKKLLFFLLHFICIVLSYENVRSILHYMDVYSLPYSANYFNDLVTFYPSLLVPVLAIVCIKYEGTIISKVLGCIYPLLILIVIIQLLFFAY